MIPPEEEEKEEQTVQHDPSQGTSDQVHWSHEPEVLPDEGNGVPHHHETDTDREKGEDTTEQDTDNKRYGLRRYLLLSVSCSLSSLSSSAS